jgi:hypothetical protein
MQKIASVSNGGFIFCRVSIALLIWLAYIFGSYILLSLVLIILLFSALLTVKNAPMILIWDYTLGRIFKSKKVVLELDAMRFAHSLGTLFALVCLILWYINPRIGMIATLMFAIIKTISTAGFCPASKLYSCVSNSGCCMLKK